jgi:hypothetical protein
VPLEIAVKNPSESAILRRLRGGQPRNGDLPTWDDLKEVFANIVTIYDLNSAFLKSLEEMRVHMDESNDYELQLGDAFHAVVLPPSLLL